MRLSRSSLQRNEPLVGDIAVEEDRANRLELHEAVGVDQVDPHEAESGVADLGRAQPGTRQVWSRMAWSLVAFLSPPSSLIASLTDSPNRTRSRTGLLPFVFQNHDLHAAVELAAEIEQDARLIAQHARTRRIKRDLPGALRQQRLRILHALLTVPDDAAGPYIPPHPRIGIHASRGLWTIDRQW